MASAISNTTTNVSPGTNKTAVNPKGELQSDDFLKLLLIELQHQDPTSPMDTDKMLSQTSQLSALQAQNATKIAMEDMTKSFQASAGYGLTNAIGKMATISDNSIALTKGKTSTIDFYLPEAATKTSLVITDSKGTIVTAFDLGTQPQSNQSVKWDGTDSKGVAKDTGTYKATVYYNDADGKARSVQPGRLPVESVKFTSSGEPQLKVGSQYLPMSKITELSY